MSLVDVIRDWVREGKHLAPQVLYHGKELGGRLQLPFYSEREIVFFGHGYGARGRSLEYHARRVHEEGFNAVLHYYPFWQDLEEVASSLLETIKEYYPRQDSLQKVHLVGHSMGGLVMCEASRLAPKLISSVTCLGTPFGGTTKAAWGVGKSAEQLLPGSSYLQKLLKDEFPHEINYFVVQGTRDKVISETESRLPLPQENITHHFVETGHLGLTGKKGYQIVRKVLSSGVNRR